MFDPKVEADKLFKAMKGVGNDKEKVIDITTSHNNYQRLQIRESYKSQFD